MKKILLVLSVLGMGIAQTSSAAETTFQPNNTLSHTITNIAASANHGSSRNIYSINGGANISDHDEINKAIANLSVHAKQKEYQLAALTKRLEYKNKGSAHKDSLADMKKWAEQGNVEYQLKVGSIYYEGEGVRQDLVLSRKMFQKAAIKGNARGQSALGFFYEDGLGGLKRNRTTAKEWYGKACDKGYQYGCDQYRRLNERGY